MHVYLSCVSVLTCDGMVTCQRYKAAGNKHNGSLKVSITRFFFNELPLVSSPIICLERRFMWKNCRLSEKWKGWNTNITSLTQYKSQYANASPLIGKRQCNPFAAFDQIIKSTYFDSNCFFLSSSFFGQKVKQWCVMSTNKPSSTKFCQICSAVVLLCC